MKKLSGKFGLTACALGVLAVVLPLQASAGPSVVVVVSHAKTKTDLLGRGPSATPLNINFYAAAGTTAAPCDKILNLMPGSSYSSTVGATGKCSTINHFVVTPLASNTAGTMFPFGTTSIDTTVSSVTSTVAAYVVGVTGADTAGTPGTLVNGIPACTTAGAAAGSGDESVRPIFDTTSHSNIVMCAGVLDVIAFPSIY